MLESPLYQENTENEREKKEGEKREIPACSLHQPRSRRAGCAPRRPAVLPLFYTQDTFSLVQFGLDPPPSTHSSAVCCRGHSRGLSHTPSLEAELIQHGCLSRQTSGGCPPMQNQESPPPQINHEACGSDTGSHFGGRQLSLQTGFSISTALYHSQPNQHPSGTVGRQAGRQTHHNPPPPPLQGPGPPRAGKSGSSDSGRVSVDKGRVQRQKLGAVFPGAFHGFYLLGTLPNRID